MAEFLVNVEKDHIERLTSARPLAAISELIWNAYDADAKKVFVEFEAGDLTELALIRVRDDGNGIPLEKAKDYFSSLGGSWKKNTVATPGGRLIHGEKGQGRFKAFALGDSVEWISKNGGQQFSINGRKENLKRFQTSDPIQANSSGCIVEISDIQKDFEMRAKHGFDEKVRDVFALHLHENPDFQITYDGVEIDARDAIRQVTEYEVEVPSAAGESLVATLSIIEWIKHVERKLMLCKPEGFSFHSMAPGIQARGFNFTAYLKCDYFQELVDENSDALVELDQRAVTIIDAAKEKMREHFRLLEAERSRDKIQEWKDADIYPYPEESVSAIDDTERQVFNVVALNLADYSSEFDRSSEKQKRLILSLVKTAVETDPETIPALLEKVIDLPKERQEELAGLLKRTSLSAIISAAKSVADRLDFLKALQMLIFEAESKKQLLERSQLHRIIAQETWIFGEQFNLINDDEDLTTVLKSHLKLLGKERTELAPEEPVVDSEGRAAVVDLMLSCRIPTPTDDERKHLVVELKRPSQPINEDVIEQVKRYAKAIALDDRFKGTGVTWDVVAVSNRFTDGAKLEARQVNMPVGQVAEYNDGAHIRVWAKTWGEVISEAEGRLTFYKRGLEYRVTEKGALEYLRGINESYLSDTVKSKLAELADDENEGPVPSSSNGYF